MNNKRILQTIGIFFILITTSVHSKESTSGQSKNNSTTIENLINLEKKSIHLRARVTIYYANETVYNKKKRKHVYNSDKDTDNGKTASLVKIKTLQNMGLEVFAVNPAIMPYGTVISFVDNAGNKKVGVAVDTGGAVKSAKASGGTVPVIDIYSNKAMTGNYHNFQVTKYTGPNFKTRLTHAQRLEYLQQVRDVFISLNNQLAAR